MKHILRRLVNKVGLEIGRYRSPNSLEGHLWRLLTSLGVNCVIDVGAHWGEYAALVRRIGYRGRIVSFEPVAENYAKLQRECRHDFNWRGMQMALGDRTGRVAINVLPASDLCSFLQPTPYAKDWIGSLATVSRTEVVQVRALDEIIEVCVAGLDVPWIFLKLDTQGFDSAVLRGASRTLKNVAAIQTEVAVRPLYEGMRLFPESVTDVLALGYELTGLFPVAREADQIAQIEFDCVVRRLPKGGVR